MKNTLLIGAILLIVGSTRINGDTTDTTGRLLTPEEGCGHTKVKFTRIVGGSEAKNGSWPWISLLAYEKGNETFFDCGGSLITSRHVLTAAHCLRDPDDELKLLKFVRLGEHDLRTTEDGQHQDINITRALAHEEYSTETHVNDIAMLYLQHDVEFSARIRPICLPLDEPLLSRVFTDQNPFVAGWGDMDVWADPAQVLMQLQIPVVDNERCKQLISKVDADDVNAQVTDRVICARLAGNKGIWKGDSGGPLMLPIFQNGLFPFYLIGIVSRTYGFAREELPEIYTKVQYYADWIKEHVRE